MAFDKTVENYLRVRRVCSLRTTDLTFVKPLCIRLNHLFFFFHVNLDVNLKQHLFSRMLHYFNFACIVHIG